MEREAANLRLRVRCEEEKLPALALAIGYQRGERRWRHMLVGHPRGGWGALRVTRTSRNETLGSAVAGPQLEREAKQSPDVSVLTTSLPHLPCRF